MKDFTKEELIDLNIIVSVSYAKYIDDKQIEALCHKLQSMIDNYCEHEFITADMKKCQAICNINDGGKTYLTITGDIFSFGQYAALDMAHKIICILALGENKFPDEWVERIISRLRELKNDNQ